MAMDPVRILLVEDDPTDVVCTEETLKNSPFQIELHLVSDGDEALANLERQARFSGIALPDLLLVDLNLAMG